MRLWPSAFSIRLWAGCSVVVLGLAGSARAQCEWVETPLGLLSPSDDDAIPLTPEFRFDSVVGEFNIPIVLVADDGAEDEQRLHASEGNGSVLVVDRALRPGVGYDLWEEDADPGCSGPGCARFVATFNAVDTPWPTPPSPVINAVTQVEEWEVEWCYESTFVEGPVSLDTKWIEVSLETQRT